MLAGFVGRESDADFERRLQENEVDAQRRNRAREQAIRLGNDFYSWGNNHVRLPDNQAASTKNLPGVSGGINTSSTDLNSRSASSLFGGDLNTSLDSFTDRAKDLARFRLGLDNEQARFSRTLREEESQSNFGRTLQQMGRQFEIDTGLQGQLQNALTNRLKMELTNRKELQSTDIGQQNLSTNRAIRLASRGL